MGKSLNNAAVRVKAIKLKTYLILCFAFALLLAPSLKALADGQSVRLNSNHINIFEQSDALLIQGSDTPKSTIHINKDCARERNICLSGRTVRVCETHWRCDYYPIPYDSCMSSPYVICTDEFICDRQGVEQYVKTEKVKVEFDKKASLKCQAERYFVLQCGGLRHDGLNIITNATDVRLRRGFWNHNFISVKG